MCIRDSPINSPQYKDEFLVFLGASYFRAVGEDQPYGMSARGLALNTAEPGGEEFPVFEQFWLVRPAADATPVSYTHLDVYKRQLSVSSM